METKKLPKPIEFLAGHGLTVVCLVLLMVLTIIGTVAQKYIGLFQSQQKYFNSAFLWYHIFDSGDRSYFIPVFPGGILILTVLFINLLTAFIFKFRFRARMIGVWICHIGLFLMLVGAFVAFEFSSEGHLTLAEGEQSDRFVSYHFHEFEIKDLSLDKNTIFPHGYIGLERTLSSPKFPFKVQFQQFYRNCQAMQADWRRPSKTGQEFYLKPIAAEVENEKNRAGGLVELYCEGKRIGRFFVVSEIPIEFNFHGHRYGLLLRKKQTEIPYGIKLIKFTREIYPGTTTPKHFESKVEVIEQKQVDGNPVTSSRPVLISMNRPLRHMGYTFYQSSYAQDSDRQYSTLAVVKNPNPFPDWPDFAYWLEKWPHISCLLISLGMLIHFLPKLFKFVQRKQT